MSAPGFLVDQLDNDRYVCFQTLTASSDPQIVSQSQHTCATYHSSVTPSPGIEINRSWMMIKEETGEVQPPSIHMMKSLGMWAIWFCDGNLIELRK